jgi:hypothetical protein
LATERGGRQSLVGADPFLPGLEERREVLVAPPRKGQDVEAACVTGSTPNSKMVV